MTRASSDRTGTGDSGIAPTDTDGPDHRSTDATAPRPEVSDTAVAESDTDEGPAPPSPMGRLATIAAHLGVTVLGVIGVVLALMVGAGTPDDPGPGLWPLAAAALMAAAGVATVVQSFRGGTVESLSGSARPGAGVALMIVFVLLFSFVSVIVALLVLFVLWTRLLGGMRWPAVIAWSVAGSIGLYLLFGVLIATPFPAPLTPVP